jgi:hypothetical protein
MVNKKKNSDPVNNTEQSITVYATHGGFPGEINLLWDALKNAKSYAIQLSHSSPKNWKQIDIIFEPVYMINGLKTGKLYFFRVAPIFRNGQGAWSNPVSKKVK